MSISHEDCQSLAETDYLLKNPMMAKRLLEAVVDVKNGKTLQQELIEEA